MNFSTFKFAVAAQFNRISQGQVFRTEVTGDELWETYLSSFPSGSNPLFRERSEHDCSCCKQFVRAVGNIVAIINNELVSIWEIPAGSTDPEYAIVAAAMAAKAKSKKIDNLFYHFEKTAGTDRSFEQMVDGVKTWEHFFINIPQRFVNKEPGSQLGRYRAAFDVTLRGINEISEESVDTVLGLIAQGSLYRGQEHLTAVTNFRVLQRSAKNVAEVDNYVWENITNAYGMIRNTVIGTLLTDLSEGVDIDRAVASFESKVAPTNYKRPTALVTQRMVDDAKKKIESLGLLSALDRRFATEADINASNVLFVNRSTSVLKAEDPFNGIAKGERKSARVDEVSLAQFLDDILPTATSIELSLEGRHQGNMMSLVAPADPTAGHLFQWGNNFSWSYVGDVTDSIKERVKSAGGNVTGDLCCRLAWYNYDDLDLHMLEPNGNEICFHNRRSHTGGMLDVDMNAGVGFTREPVENIFYSSRNSMPEGIYTLFVHNYSRRETTNVGFDAEIDFLGTTYKFAHENAVMGGAKVVMAKFKYSKKDGLQIIESLPFSSLSKEIWGVKTEEFVKVKMVTLSPNHWDGEAVGNSHVFFILDGCVNPLEARGFYNEFLDNKLTEHRKVFEILGAKMKTPYTPNQLSGVGFSTTKRDQVLLKVTGAFTRNILVNI